MKREMLLVFVFLFSLTFISAETLLGSSEGSVTTYGGATCVNNQTFSYWADFSNGINTTTYNSSGTYNNCSFYAKDSDSFCCPSGANGCNFSTGKCMVSVSNVTTTCSGYKDENSCVYAEKVVAIKSVESMPGNSGFCSRPSTVSGSCTNSSASCKCTWNSTTSKCNPSGQIVTVCSNSVGDFTATCNWAETSYEDKCNTEGKIIITYTASGSAVGSDWCKNPNLVEFSCTESVELPFFNWFSFLLSGLAIMVIYFISLNKINIYKLGKS